MVLSRPVRPLVGWEYDRAAGRRFFFTRWLLRSGLTGVPLCFALHFWPGLPMPFAVAIGVLAIGHLVASALAFRAWYPEPTRAPLGSTARVLSVVVLGAYAVVRTLIHWDDRLGPLAHPAPLLALSMALLLASSHVAHRLIRTSSPDSLIK